MKAARGSSDSSGNGGGSTVSIGPRERRRQRVGQHAGSRPRRPRSSVVLDRGRRGDARRARRSRARLGVLGLWSESRGVVHRARLERSRGRPAAASRGRRTGDDAPASSSPRASALGLGRKVERLLARRLVGAGRRAAALGVLSVSLAAATRAIGSPELVGDAASALRAVVGAARRRSALAPRPPCRRLAPAQASSIVARLVAPIPRAASGRAACRFDARPRDRRRSSIRPRGARRRRSARPPSAPSTCAPSPSAVARARVAPGRPASPACRGARDRSRGSPCTPPSPARGAPPRRTPRRRRGRDRSPRPAAPPRAAPPPARAASGWSPARALSAAASSFSRFLMSRAAWPLCRCYFATRFTGCSKATGSPWNVGNFHFSIVDAMHFSISASVCGAKRHALALPVFSTCEARRHRRDVLQVGLALERLLVAGAQAARVLLHDLDHGLGRHVALHVLLARRRRLEVDRVELDDLAPPAPCASAALASASCSLRLRFSFLQPTRSVASLALLPSSVGAGQAERKGRRIKASLFMAERLSSGSQRRAT